MKKLIFTLGFLLLLLRLSAQVPQAYNYQAVARDSNGICLSNQLISLQVGIRDSSEVGPLVYLEEFRGILTNDQRLFSISIGTGTPQPLPGGTPKFNDIYWGNAQKWFEVALDPANGFNFKVVGNQQFLSVPYAINAENVLGEPVGTVKMFWNAGGQLPIPKGWMILDGSIVNDPVSPLNGQTLPDMTNRYAVGMVGNNTIAPMGNLNHQVDLSHSHTVNSHNHSIPSHTHSMAHTHTSGTYSTLFGWDNQGDVAVRKGSFSSYPAWGTSFNDALNTSGNLSFSNVGTSELSTNTASIDVAGTSGPSSRNTTGSGGNGNTGSSSPGTSSQLSANQSIQPESIGFLYIIKVK